MTPRTGLFHSSWRDISVDLMVVPAAFYQTSFSYDSHSGLFGSRSLSSLSGIPVFRSQIRWMSRSLALAPMNAQKAQSHPPMQTQPKYHIWQSAIGFSGSWSRSFSLPLPSSFTSRSRSGCSVGYPWIPPREPHLTYNRKHARKRMPQDQEGFQRIRGSGQAFAVRIVVLTD
jgi:hypothetical protein